MMLRGLLRSLAPRCYADEAADEASAQASRDFEARMNDRDRRMRPMLARLAAERRANHFAPRIREALREEDRRGPDPDTD